MGYQLSYQSQWYEACMYAGVVYQDGKERKTLHGFY
jgi:hypothetical protein